MTHIIVEIKETHNFPTPSKMSMNLHLNCLNIISMKAHFINNSHSFYFVMNLNLIYDSFFLINHKSSLPLMCLSKISTIKLDWDTFFVTILIYSHRMLEILDTKFLETH